MYEIYILVYLKRKCKCWSCGLIPSNQFMYLNCFHFRENYKNKRPEELKYHRTFCPHYLCEVPTASQGQHVKSIET